MANRLDGRKVAVLVADGFEQVELTEPVKALKEAGAQVKIVSPMKGQVQGVNHDKKGDAIPVDQPLDGANAGDFDALLLPGGVMNPDTLRINDKAIAFTRAFFEAGKPVAAICHGPQLLISAGLVKGRKMTGYSAIQVDLANAGAQVSDTEVIVDQGLVTSRNPKDIPAFNAKMVEEFAEGRHRGQRVAAE
ncbi:MULTISPECIES: type 1 glutamine amidotransferase domain-containing protein [Azorhizobium]|uniref:Proteinase I n=1 Tax=Azorhizobium caulinodans (strain ATCC 43989 / DSM 5975 / JCM 20966 / LMG 6465 / NBRC 14845 / NCIMB 13405 / ORS 571) TaxID=438753 RepID=A8IMI1_AZOC5|nr:MULTISPECIES: type 1 glutamine amidotransferase domain-containing protein [Azorhizobium]TDT96428.1 protease I [Azorhizobium sp. AG788]BAF86555.1 proteinase I [Azorhizobium caulinodans ORS 571]